MCLRRRFRKLGKVFDECTALLTSFKHNITPHIIFIDIKSVNPLLFAAPIVRDARICT